MQVNLSKFKQHESVSRCTFVTMRPIGLRPLTERGVDMVDAREQMQSWARRQRAQGNLRRLAPQVCPVYVVDDEGYWYSRLAFAFFRTQFIKDKT